MSQRIKDLKEKRAKLVADAREISKLAEGEKRELNKDEETRQDAIFAEVETLGKTIEREEKLAAAELEVRSKEDKTPAPTEVRKDDSEELPEEIRKLHKRALRTFILEGAHALSPEMIRAVMEAHGKLNVREMSAFSAGQSVMLAPQEWNNQIIKDLTKKVAVRRMASIFPVNTLAGLGVPTLAEDTEEFDMTPELTAPSAAADISLGKRELRPHQASKMIKLPLTLMQSSTINVDGLAGDMMADKFARTEDNMYCNGSGSQRPLGLFVASAFGINTDRDTVCGSSTNFTWDGMIDVVAALREEYQVGAKWLLPRNAWAKLRKLKDGEGRYVWEPSVRVGEPDVILGYPYEFSDFVPSTYTTGQYVGMFGNFSFYWIVEFAFTYVQKLVELYALTNQIALIGRRWFDGAPVQPKAFVRMKLG